MKILHTILSHLQPWKKCITSKLLRWRHIGGRKIGGPRNTCSSLLLQHCPVEGVVVLVVERPEEDSEELTQVHVVWRLLEAQPTAVVEVHCKLCWETLAQHLDTAFKGGSAGSSQGGAEIIKLNFFVVKQAATHFNSIAVDFRPYTQNHTKKSTSTGVDIFFSLIFSYFCFLVAAFSPCHGSEPLRASSIRRALEKYDTRLVNLVPI